MGHGTNPLTRERAARGSEFDRRLWPASETLHKDGLSMMCTPRPLSHPSIAMRLRARRQVAKGNIVVAHSIASWRVPWVRECYCAFLLYSA
jgi:hypothetical protein